MKFMYAVKQNTKKANLYITQATNIDYKITKSLHVKDIVTKEEAEEIQKLVKDEFGIGSKVIELELVEKNTQSKSNNESVIEHEHEQEEVKEELEATQEIVEDVQETEPPEPQLEVDEFDVNSVDTSDFAPTPEPLIAQQTNTNATSSAPSGFSKAWG